MPNIYTEIANMKTCRQSQESLQDQLCDLILAANKLGLYDAADYLKRVVSGVEEIKE